MKKLIPVFALTFAFVFAALFSCSSNDAVTASNAGSSPTATLPFQISFVPVSAPNLQALQSYVHAEVPASGGQGVISLLIGGRVPGDQNNQGGLHTFEGAPAQNFPQNTSSTYMRTLNPATGELHSFSVLQLGSELATALSVTNAQSAFDESSGLLYITGGYGWKADGSDMATSDALMALKVAPIVAEIQKPNPDPKVIAAAIQIAHDPAYKVTGGKMAILNGQFYLVFGQLFDGQYRAFGGTDFTQNYTECYRIFRLKAGTLTRIGPVSSVAYPTDKIEQDGHPFHRRDGNIVEEVSPADGSPRLTSIGGVFKPGVIGAYVNPIYISADGSYQVDLSFEQKFNQYESPVILAWSSNSKTLYRTLVGGIGHYFLHQSPSHKEAYLKVSQEKRNDGFPFVEDVSFQVQTADGSTSEYVATDPLPGSRLLGASADFLELPSLKAAGWAQPNGVLNLDKFPAGKATLIGYVYGGIEADNPLPLIPNSGTHGTNELMQVILTVQPTAVVPASQGHEAVPTGKPHG